MSEAVLMAWSGGKDAAMALARLRADPCWQVAGLLCHVDGDGSARGQGVPAAILRRQAELLRLPLFEAPWLGPDNAAYEASFAASLAQAREQARGQLGAVRHVASGDVFLADVRAYREALLARHGCTGVFPLWHEDTAALARRFAADGNRALVCRVDTAQLDAGFCGREFDPALLAQLPASCDPCGERGEFHTCLHAGPLLGGSIALARDAGARCDGRFVEIGLRIA